MTRSLIITSIRVAVLAVAAITAGVPWYIVFPIALVMPPLFSTTVTCTSGGCSANTAPGSVTITGSNFAANGGCCAYYDASFVVPFFISVGGPPGACLYRLTGDTCQVGNIMDFKIIDQTTF